MRKDFLIGLKDKLPEKPGVLGREEYLNTAVLLPLMFLNGEYHLILQKRAEGISQGNEICFPGGHFDPQMDKSLRDTALRETIEELGITTDDVTIIGQLDTLVTPRGVIVEPFVGTIGGRSLAEFTPDPKEVGEVFSVPLSWFLKNEPEVYENRIVIQSSYQDGGGKERILLPVEELGLPSLYKGSREGGIYKVYVYQTAPYIIWGLTAKILFHFVSLLGSDTNGE
jgi:peroxisomal coenzyme A diphosphatase NUDT7